MHVCMWMHKRRDSNHCRAFYTAIFLNACQIHTKAQEQNILSPRLPSKLSDSASISVCYSFQEPGPGAHAYLCSDFYEGYGEKIGFVGLSFLSSPLVISGTWFKVHPQYKVYCQYKDSKASRDNGGVQTKDFMDEYLFTLCVPPGEHWILTSFAPKNAGSGTFSFQCDLINFLGIKLCLRLHVCSYTPAWNFLLLFSSFSFWLCTCCWLLILLDTANVLGDRKNSLICTIVFWKPA